MSDLFDRYGRWLVHHRMEGSLLCLALSILAMWAILDRLAVGLPVDFTPQALFMDGGPEIRRIEQIEDNYGREDNDVVVLVEGPLATPAGVDSLRRLHAALAAVEQVEEVQSLVNAVLPVMTDGRLEIIAPLDHWPPAEALARATSDPTLAGLLVARRDEPTAPSPVDDDIAALRVRIDRKLGPVAELAPAVDAVLAAARSVPLPSRLTLSVTGVPLIRTEVVDLMQADELHFLPIVAGIFALTTGILFRRFWSGLAPLFVTLIGTLWALGVLFGAGLTLNVLSALVPVLTVVIGVSDGIHIVARYREELDPPDSSDDARVAEGRVSAADAMGRTLRHMTTACFLTTFTTAAGFLSLSLAQTRVVRDFGIHCAVAVVVVWVSVMLLLPVWLAWIPPAAVGPRLQREYGTSLLAGLDAFVARHSRGIVLWSLLLVSLAAWLASGVRAQSSLMEMYRPGQPTWEAVHQADTRLGGIVPLMVHIALPDQGSAHGEPMLEPDILGPMATLQDELVARPEIGWASSPASVIRQINRLLSDEDGVPKTRTKIAQELLLAELSGDLGLRALMAPDRSSGRILLLARDAGGRALLQIQRETQERAAQLFSGTGARIDVTGDGFIASAGLQRLVKDLVSSVGLVLIVIVVTMWALLGDLRLALLAAIPNVMPLVFTAATLRLMGADLQVTNIVSFTVAVGLAVDDTIHFVARYREERQRGASPRQAITRTYHGAGRAITLTSLLLILGFGVLGFSELASTRFFGILSSVTMTAALAADLLLLPAMLHLLERQPRAARRSST